MDIIYTYTLYLGPFRNDLLKCCPPIPDLTEKQASINYAAPNANLYSATIMRLVKMKSLCISCKLSKGAGFYQMCFTFDPLEGKLPISY